MPTIIDSLIVTLGLNSKELDSKSVEAGKKLKDLEGQSAKTEGGVKKIGTTSKESASGVETLTRSLGAFLGLIGGTMAIRKFVEDTVASNAALQRFSQNIGLSVTDVSAWGNAVEQMGGSAKGLQGTMDMLSKSQTELRLTGQSSLIPYFSSLGVAIAGVGGKARPVDEILLDLADRFSHMDRTQANNMGRMMGIDQDTMNLLLQGRREVELTIKRQKEYGAVSKEQAAEGVKLQRSMVELRQSFTAFGRDLLQQASPAIEKLIGGLQSLSGWVQTNKEFVVDFLTVVAAGLGAIALAALPMTGTVAAITAVGAAIALLYQDYQTWKRGGDSFVDWQVWKDRIDAVAASIHKLRDALAGVEEKTEKFLEKSPTYKKFNDWFVKKGNTSPVTNGAASLGGVGAHGQTDAAYMQKFFKDRGMSDAAAAGLAANLMSESSGRANAAGDNGTAYGLGQWHADRQADFKSFAGKGIGGSSVDEQLAFVMYELTHKYAGAGKALSGANNAYDAGSIVSRLYERPADKDGEATRRGIRAQALLGIQGASSTVAAAGNTGASSTSTDRSVSVTTGDINIHTQATDAPGIAQGMKTSLDYLFTSHANSGAF